MMEGSAAHAIPSTIFGGLPPPSAAYALEAIRKRRRGMTRRTNEAYARGRKQIVTDQIGSWCERRRSSSSLDATDVSHWTPRESLLTREAHAGTESELQLVFDSAREWLVVTDARADRAEVDHRDRCGSETRFERRIASSRLPVKKWMSRAIRWRS